MENNFEFRKVSVSKQTNYVYHGVSQDYVIVPDAERGVTIDFIRDLHRDDNRVVEQNLKQSRKPMTDSERRDIEAWRNDPEHPERTKSDFPDDYQRWNLPIDGCWNEEDGSNSLDSDPVMERSYREAQHEVPPTVERLREFISTLTERQQELYRLVYIEECPLKEAARVMGITTQRASTIANQVRNNIEKRFNI